MNKRTLWILIAVVALIAIAVALGASGTLWQWLLALHGRH